MPRRRSLEDLAKDLNKGAGKELIYAATDPSLSEYDVISTGSLALDYALGTGGWPDRYMVEVMGPPDIGKNSLIGFSAIREAQKQDKACAIVAIEPGFDEAWARKHGVDPDQLIIAPVESGEEAFHTLYKLVTSDLIGLVVFDSIGALLRESEQGEEGTAKVAGQAGLITWGVKNVAMQTFKHRCCVLFLNQIRDDMSPYGFDPRSPGGHALKHLCMIRVQLKPGKERYFIGTKDDKVMIGRQVVAVVKRNKMNEGSDQRATLDFYFKETEDHPVGIDGAADVFNTAMRAGVIKSVSKGWYGHPTFPGKEHKINGKRAVGEYIHDNPKVLDTIRKEVLEVMYDELASVPDLKVVDGSGGE